MILAMGAADLAQGRLAEALPRLSRRRAVIVGIPQDDTALPGNAVYVAAMAHRPSPRLRRLGRPAIVSMVVCFSPEETHSLMRLTALGTGRLSAERVPRSGYRTWIEKAPKGDAVQLHLGVKRMPYETTDGFRADWQRLMNTDPFIPFRENRLVFHGIRKNAVINLLEVGCTETQVGAICNMSEEMVRHYGKEVRVRVLARDGMKLLESRWGEVRQPALEQEQNANWKPAVRIGNRWERDSLAKQRKNE